MADLEGDGDGGGGVENRWTRCLGIFTDGRFVVPASTRNYGMVRLGVRFVF
jgi:hypothetical protein